jgi:hypothetical protein
LTEGLAEVQTTIHIMASKMDKLDSLIAKVEAMDQKLSVVQKAMWFAGGTILPLLGSNPVVVNFIKGVFGGTF